MSTRLLHILTKSMWSHCHHTKCIVHMSPRIQEVVLVNERFLDHQYIFSLDISNISASFAGISWRSVLLVEETAAFWDNHWSFASRWQTLSHKFIMLYCVHLDQAGFELTKLMVIGTDCIDICSCKSNYNTITTKTVPLQNQIG